MHEESQPEHLHLCLFGSVSSLSESSYAVLSPYLDSEVPLGEVPLLLLLLLGDEGGLVLGQPPADSAGLLWAEVEWQVLLALVEDAELRALVKVDDGEDTGDRLADVVAVKPSMSENVPFCETQISSVCDFIRREWRTSCSA